MPAKQLSPQDPRGRWAIFEQRFAERVRASDAAWADRLTTTERLAIVDDLLATMKAVRGQPGEWDAIDAQAWLASLDERKRVVAALHRFDEVTRGHGPETNAR